MTPNSVGFSSLAAPVPQSQKGQGPGPVSGAWPPPQGAWRPLLHAAGPRPWVVSWPRLTWSLRGSEVGHSPFISIFLPAPLGICIPCWDPGGVCAWAGIPLCCTQAEQLTQHPHRPSMPLPAGTRFWPSFMGHAEESRPLQAEALCRLDGAAGAGSAFPGEATAALTSKVCCWL